MPKFKMIAPLGASGRKAKISLSLTPVTKTTPPIFTLFDNPLVELGATQTVLTADCAVSHSVSTLTMTVSQEIYTIIIKAFPATR